VATLNINGVASGTLLGMLEEFLWKQDIDLALLQEVTNPHLLCIHKWRNRRAGDGYTDEGRPNHLKQEERS